MTLAIVVNRTHCNAPGCEESIEATDVFCSTHWPMLCRETQAFVWASGLCDPNGEASQRAPLAMRLALAELASHARQLSFPTRRDLE